MSLLSRYINLIVIVFSTIIVISILVSTYLLVQNYKDEERNKMEIWSLATSELLDVNGQISNLNLEVLKKNTSTPMIKMDYDGKIEINNIKNVKVSDTVKINKLILKFKSENNPIPIFLNGKKISTLYYGNSSVLNKLKFYPIALILFTISFVLITILFYKNLKISEINSLWSSMAKETAHQIGTPLSSLIGWIELIKNKSKNTPYINEIEKDVNRLTTISERFGKIGSKPKLEKHDLAIEIGKTVKYLNERISNKIKIDFKQIESNIYAKINPQLFSWCLENIIKNSVDAIEDKGTISIAVQNDSDHLCIYIKDNGKGMSKKLFKNIFEAGYTTKKRGWGLGLSLAKRIIEDYHLGKIKVLESKINEGTTFEIRLNRFESI
jgi:sensor histidine kinase regulating citrate/malate metabolism